MPSQTFHNLSEEDIQTLALTLSYIDKGRTAVPLEELTVPDIDSVAIRHQLESLDEKGFGYLESRNVCAECSSDLIAGVCTENYLHEGIDRVEKFSPYNPTVRSAISSWLLQHFSELGWAVERDKIAESAQIDYVLRKNGIIATLNIHTSQLDFERLMADVGKSKESEINAIFIVVFAYGVSSRAAATYLSTHPEVVFFQASDLSTLEDKTIAFDEDLERRLNSVDLSRHLIKRYQGTDFGSPIEQLLHSWSEIVSELPSLACQDPLMVKKYGSPAKVGLIFEKNCASLMGSMFRIVKLGRAGQPDGVVVIPDYHGGKLGLLLYECKSTANQPYRLNARDRRQVLEYLDSFRREEAREVYNLIGIVLISYEFDEDDCIEKQESMRKLLPERGCMSFLPVASLLTMGEKYVKMLPETRIRLEYDYSVVRRLFSSKGAIDSENVSSFLRDIENKEVRIERDLRDLLR